MLYPLSSSLWLQRCIYEHEDVQRKQRFEDHSSFHRQLKNDTRAHSVFHSYIHGALSTQMSRIDRVVVLGSVRQSRLTLCIQHVSSSPFLVLVITPLGSRTHTVVFSVCCVLETLHGNKC